MFSLLFALLLVLGVVSDALKEKIARMDGRTESAYQCVCIYLSARVLGWCLWEKHFRYQQRDEEKIVEEAQRRCCPLEDAKTEGRAGRLS